MKHKFAIMMFCFFTFLGKLAFANPYQVGSQQWHNWNAAMSSQADKIKAQRQQNSQNNIPQNNEQHYNRLKNNREKI